MKRFPHVRVYGIILLANHLHAIISSDQVDLDQFMGYWLGNVAKEVNRLRDRGGPLFGRRYSASALLDDESARTKLAYLLLNPTAAKLVADPAQWPGITSLAAQTGGPQLVGHLPDRAELKRRKKRGESVTEADVMVEYPITISPLPEFADHDIEGQQRAVSDLVQCELESVRKQLEQQTSGSKPVRFLGLDGILTQDPEGRPRKSAFSPQPLCHASKSETKAIYLEHLANIERAYDRAMDRYRAGLAPNFPPGTRPPGWARAVRPAHKDRSHKLAA